MGWSTELFCNISYNRKTFNSKIEVEDEISDLTYEIFNRVDYGKFSIHKVGAASSSDWADPEKDVEFVAVLLISIRHIVKYS